MWDFINRAVNFVWIIPGYYYPIEINPSWFSKKDVS